MTVKINISERPSQIFTVNLDQVAYRMKVRWNDRVTAWYIDLYDISGQAIFLSHRLLYNRVILSKYRANALCPQGELILYDTTTSLDRPSFETLSTTDQLYYLTASEVESGSFSQSSV